MKSDYAEAYNNRAVVLVDLGKLKPALESYDKAILLKPQYGDAIRGRDNLIAMQKAKH